MTIEIHAAVDPGRSRSNNEDSVATDDGVALAVLADGMGGYNAGEVASAMAVDCVVDHMARWVAESRGPRDEAEIRQALMAGASHANKTVFEASQSRAEYAGMGTTLVAALFNDDRLWIGHIGDSRAYRWRAGRLEQLSRDHSLLQEQIDAGLLTPEEAVFSMNRNLVTRAVGVEPEVELEIVGHEVRSGDTVLLCSDGLSDMLPDPAIAQVMRANDSLATTAHALIAAANAAGGRDNISVVLVHAKGGAAPTGRAWWPFRRA